MLGLGLYNALSKEGTITPGVVTSNLVMKHNFDGGAVVPVSDGAASINAPGTDEYIDMGNVCNLGAEDFSIAFWVYLPEATNQYLMSKRNTSQDYWRVMTQGSDKIQFLCKGTVDGVVDTSILDLSGTINISENKWSHVAITCDRNGESGLKIYVNGVLESARAPQHTESIDNAGDLKLGQYNTSEMQGYMCNVGIWSEEALTQSQVRSIMNKRYAELTSTEKDNLVSWWNLDTSYTDENNDASTVVFDNHHAGGETLGSELVSNGDFSNWTGDNPSEWYVSLTGDTDDYITQDPDGGAALYISTGGDDVYIRQLSIFSIGKTYKISLEVTKYTSGQVGVYHNSKTVASISSVGTLEFYVKAIEQNLIINQSGTVNITFDNISVKEVLGNTGELK